MFEVAHYAPLAPLAALGWTRDTRRTYVLVAAGFAVSWLADTVALLMGGSTAVTALYPLVQFGVLAVAFGGWGLALLLPWVAVVQQLVVPGPDFLVTAIGSLGVLYLSDRHPLGASMTWFCGVALVFALPMIAGVGDPSVFMTYWWPYQAARLVAFGLFVRAALKAR